MRDQDIVLLKNLIRISETIRKMTRGRSNIRTNQRTTGRSSGALAVGEGRARLIRQMSEPQDCRTMSKEEELTGSSVGSLEGKLLLSADCFRNFKSARFRLFSSRKLKSYLKIHTLLR